MVGHKLCAVVSIKQTLSRRDSGLGAYMEVFTECLFVDTTACGLLDPPRLLYLLAQLNLLAQLKLLPKRD
mgnify:CR=1 FL=1